MIYLRREKKELKQRLDDLTGDTATKMLELSLEIIEDALEDAETGGPLQDLLFDQSVTGRCEQFLLDPSFADFFRAEWAVHPEKKKNDEGKRHPGRPYGSRNSITPSLTSGGIKKRRSGPRS